MENQYGIGINNRYALFLEGEDGGEALIKPPPPEPKIENNNNVVVNNMNNSSSTSNNNVRKPLKKEVSLPNKSREDKENRNNERSFPGKRVVDARKAQEGPRESREDRNNRRNRPDDRQQEPMGRGGGSGGPGGPRGGRGGRGGPGGMSRGRGKPKREFERKSGDDRTGVKAVEKREGGGSHNWGTMEDEMKAEEDKVAGGGGGNNSYPSEDAPVTEDSVRPGSDEEDNEANQNKVKTLTLEEWKAQEKDKREIPTYNTRKAGEGSEIDPKWKKTYAYKKEKETHDEEEEEDHELYPQRVNRQKRIFDIEFSFASAGNQRGRGAGRGARGGRGGPKGPGSAPPVEGGPPATPGGGGGDRDRGSGGGERRFEEGRRGGGGGGGSSRRGGSGRGGESHSAPNVNDEASFPTLGGMGK